MCTTIFFSFNFIFESIFVKIKKWEWKKSKLRKWNEWKLLQLIANFMIIFSVFNSSYSLKFFKNATKNEKFYMIKQYNFEIYNYVIIDCFDRSISKLSNCKYEIFLNSIQTFQIVARYRSALVVSFFVFFSSSLLSLFVSSEFLRLLWISSSSLNLLVSLSRLSFSSFLLVCSELSRLYWIFENKWIEYHSCYEIIVTWFVIIYRWSTKIMRKNT